MYKQSSQNSKYSFPRLSDMKRITTPKHSLKRFNFDLNYNKLHSKNAFCKKHQEPFLKYCQNCEDDLCEYCIYTHDNNHIFIQYSEIIPDQKEIELLKNTLKNYGDNYNELINEIKIWKQNLEEIIVFLEKEIEKNEILSNINFVNNFENIEINFQKIYKFRKIFSWVLGGGSGIESRKNSHIMEIIDINKSDINKGENNMGFYNYTQHNISKALLDLLTNNIINKNNNVDNSFIYKGNLIIKYLWDSFININSNQNINQQITRKNHTKKYDTSTYCGSLRYDKDDDTFFKDNISRNFSNKSKIIEKHIDLKKGSIKKKSNSNLYSNNTYDINNNSPFNNNFNRTMSTSFSTKNLLNKISSNNLGSNINGIYLKKKCNLSSANLINNNWDNKLNKTTYNIPSQFNIDNKEENNKINDNQINHGPNKNTFFKQANKINYYEKSKTLNYVNINNMNSQEIPDKIINNNSDRKNEIITSKFIPEIRIKNLIHDKNSTNNNTFNSQQNINQKINSINIDINKGRKTFKHKKLEINTEYNHIPNTFEKEEDIQLNQTQLYNKLNETSFQEDSLNNSNILNTTFNQAHSNNYFNLNKNIMASQKKKESNSNVQFITNSNTSNILDNQIKSTLFNRQMNNKLNQDLSSNNSQKIQVRKSNFDTKYIINPNMPLCISLELDNNFCKICLVNQTNQEIEIFPFAQEQYTIPMIISFNENNDIIIGHEAEQMSTVNPENTIFNLMKMFGKKYDEINGMKELWPFKIYKDEKNRPFFWINSGKKSNKFYPEDLISYFIKKLFKIFFNKIICEENLEDNITSINIILVICVPNNFTYFQRKVLQKIFEKQIFPSEQNNEKENSNSNSNKFNSNDNESYNSMNGIKLYNNYLINLKEIKIENVSSIAALCLKTINNKNKNNTKASNTLIINIGGAQTNISIACYPSYKNNNKNKSFSKKKYFGIKSMSSIELGSQDFTDTFLSDCLKEFDKNLYKKSLDTPSALAKLRRSCFTAEQIFKENSYVEIKVNKLYETYDLKMILNRSEYEKVCEDLYKKIQLEIKKALKEAKLSEINIDNILLMGNISRSEKIKNILKTMFKHNRLLYNQLTNSSKISDINNDFYSVIGGALQAKNYIYGDTFENDIEDNCTLNDISPMSFGVETINGMMEFVVKKGTSLPVQQNKYIKIKNDGEKYLEIRIYEGEDTNTSKNRLISSANIDKRNFKSEKVGNNYIEILIQFEITSDLNLCVYVLDIKTMKRRFECLINIDVKKI